MSAPPRPTPPIIDPAAQHGWVLTRVIGDEIVTLGGCPSVEDAQRAAAADAGQTIDWHEPDAAYAGWSAVVSYLPREAKSAGYLIEHRLPIDRSRYFAKPPAVNVGGVLGRIRLGERHRRDEVADLADLTTGAPA